MMLLLNTRHLYENVSNKVYLKMFPREIVN